MKHTILLSLLLAACAVDPQTSSVELELGGATSCSVPGAIPDDGLDDRAAIQAALTANGCAELGPGVYDVVVQSPRVYGGATGLDRYDMLKLAGGRTLRGAGPATTIRFSGDAGGSDVRGIGMTGNENLVEDVRLETTGWTGTNEQTHAIHVTGAALRQQVARVWFHHPSLGASAGGDCIKVVGYDPAPQPDGSTSADKRVSLIATGNVFGACDRSAIAIHSGVSEAVIASNLFLATGDQDIDLEGGGGAIDAISITGNVFRRSLNNGIAVALGADLTRKATVSGNVFAGGRFHAYNVEELTLSANAFELPGRAVELIKMSKQVAISGNTFDVSQGPNDFAVITAAHHNTGMPGSIAIANNVFRVSSNLGAIVSLVSATDATVIGNSITWTPASTPSSSTTALLIYGIVQPTESILVANNLFRGPWSRALQTTNSYEATHGGGIRAVTFGGNVLRGAGAGVYCTQPGPGPYVSYGNSGPAHACGATFSSGN